jgi:hypothetical protein
VLPGNQGFKERCVKGNSNKAYANIIIQGRFIKPVVRKDPDIHVCIGELNNKISEEFWGQQRVCLFGHAEGYAKFLLFVKVFHCLQYALMLLNIGPGFLHKRPAQFGKLHSLAAPVKKRRAELAFQLFDGV